MFTTFESALYLAAFLSILFRLFPGQIGKIIVILFSCFLIASVSWKALTFTLLLITAASAAIQWIPKKWSLSIWLVSTVPLLYASDHRLGWFDTPGIGVAFLWIRLTLEIADRQVGISPKGAFLNRIFGNFFFPTFSSGPIYRTAEIETLRTTEPWWRSYGVGIVLICSGVLKAFWIGDDVLSSYIENKFGPESDWAAVQGWQRCVLVYCKFLFLYINFSGYTDLARGFSRWFGYDMPINFNLPLVSWNPQMFWSRWHLSLTNVVRKDLYLRLLTNIRRPLVTLIITFVVMGLWHRIDLGYLIWGIGHATVFLIWVALRSTILPMRGFQKALVCVVCYLVTQGSVAIMSFVANNLEVVKLWLQ